MGRLTFTRENAMTEQPSRRAALVGAAAASLLPLASGSTRAAAPLSGQQAPGWYRYKIGSFEVTVVTDGVNRFKFADDHVTNRARADVSAAQVAAHHDANTMTTPYNPVVVNTGSRLVLIDTGGGEATYQRTKGMAGQLQANLAAAGIDRGAIDAVIISHYHGDHINGLLDAKNGLAFPNAEILVPAAEHKFFMDDGEMSRAPAGRMQTVFKNARRVMTPDVLKRIKTYEPGKEVVAGITSVDTNGHSWGHNSHIVTSGKDKVFVQGDVTHVPHLFARNPDWHAFYDQDGPKAEATRRRVYDMLVADRMLVQGFHYPFPGLAYVEKAGNGYREIPVPWSPTI
jgi:glyoxylase-like metal-dependent hydrolase (beta-lactamase superfamily II)